MTTNVQQFSGGMWLPWNLGPQADVCANLVTGRCPIPARRRVVYGFDLRIPPRLPPINRRFTILLQGITPQHQRVFCVRINAIVT